jgi:hypothetical protein
MRPVVSWWCRRATVAVGAGAVVLRRRLTVRAA